MRGHRPKKNKTPSLGRSKPVTLTKVNREDRKLCGGRSPLKTPERTKNRGSLRRPSTSDKGRVREFSR